MNFNPELKSCFLSIAEGTLLERLPLPDLIPVIGCYFERKVLEKLKRKAWIDLGQYGCVDCSEELELCRTWVVGITSVFVLIFVMITANEECHSRVNIYLPFALFA